MNTESVTKPLTRAGVVLGVGLGGFVDGILFHQILQIHSMLTARLPKDSVPNVEINMFWDGIFHLFTWIMTVLGIVLLFRARSVPNINWSARAFTGAIFVGWGLFNLIEGILNHHVFHLHHVVQTRGESIFDLLFLLSGLIFIIGGWLAIRSAKQAPGP